MEKRLEEIAKKILGLNDLATKNQDEADFSEQAVWNLKRALEEAYKAGKEEQG